MSSFSYNSAPPTQPLAAARPISASAALARLEAYLKAAETQPHLSPAFTFQDRHAQLGGAGGLGEPIQLRNLRRIASGLRGEWLGVAVDEDIFGGGGGGGGGGLGAQELMEGNDVSLDEKIAATARAIALDGENGGGDAEWDGVGGEGDVTTKSYGEQMREQGEEGEVIGEIGERNNANNLLGVSDGLLKKDERSSAKDSQDEAVKKHKTHESSKKHKIKDRKASKSAPEDVDTTLNGQSSLVSPETSNGKTLEQQSTKADGAIDKHARKLAKKKRKAEEKRERHEKKKAKTLEE